MKKYILVLFLLLPISMLAQHWETIPKIKNSGFDKRLSSIMFLDKDTFLFDILDKQEMAYYYDKKFHFVPQKDIYSKYISDSDFINRISDKKIKILNIKKDKNAKTVELALTLDNDNMGTELHFRSADKYKTIDKIYIQDSSKYYDFRVMNYCIFERTSLGKQYIYMYSPSVSGSFLLCTIEADTLKVIREDKYENLLPITKILKIDKKDNLWLSNGKYLSYYDTKTDKLIKEFRIKEIYDYGNGHATLPVNLHITDDNNLILVDARMRILYYDHEKWTLDDYAYRTLEQQQKAKITIPVLSNVHTVIDKAGNIYIKSRTISPFMFVKYANGKWEEIYISKSPFGFTMEPLSQEDNNFGFFTKSHYDGVYSIFIPED